MTGKMDNTRDKIIKGLEETYKKMVEFKKQKNSPIVVYKDGEIVELSPFEASPTTKYGHKTK
ncbi:hypothetical protein [Echinicola vietnamensis]|uniref:Uncharacterized protein n=1 Tax=Echinicola vietnamensis (strain DSM 17526 / LMG 23754 / KMM 6221) TaxID=926556 RepID=L0G4Q8_ECHVK|nr:hypothetical protein [Echinicola vietnamensis]AGA80497.1 hypothetical protein Echvi_4308 [Echinicola vietnamensis DSM 17526]